MPFCKVCGAPHAECGCWIKNSEPTVHHRPITPEFLLSKRIKELEEIIEWAANEIGGYERSDVHHFWIARELLKKIKRSEK